MVPINRKLGTLGNYGKRVVATSCRQDVDSATLSEVKLTNGLGGPLTKTAATRTRITWSGPPNTAAGAAERSVPPASILRPTPLARHELAGLVPSRLGDDVVNPDFALEQIGPPGSRQLRYSCRLDTVQLLNQSRTSTLWSVSRLILPTITTMIVRICIERLAKAWSTVIKSL